jgi:zinc/manganese transport system substrate-binding protein
MAASYVPPPGASVSLKNNRRHLPWVGAAVLVLAGCGGGEGGASPTVADEGPPLVVATTSILGDIAANVAGDEAQIEVLMPPGADPHTIQASAADAARVREADLVLAIGLGIEAPLASLLDSARAEGVDIVELAPQLDPIPFALADVHADEDDLGDEGDEGDVEDHAGEDDHDEQPPATEDPHVWFDPIRMSDGVQLLGEEFERRLGPGAWQERAADYRSELLAVHEDIGALTAAVPPERRVLVTNHEAIGYFASRYDFELAGTIIPGGTTDATPSSAAFAELARLVEDRELPAIFAENTANDTLAQALAREVGRDVEVVTLYSDGLGASGTGAETYLDLLRTNAGLIADALATS